MMTFFGANHIGGNPFEITKEWINFAKRENEAEVTAANLATVDREGYPNSRIVYVREFEPNGFVFYTNYNSKKGQELEHGKAALNFYFPKTQRQIRIRGNVEKVSEAQSDAYFLSRAEGSRLGAWVSQQSQPLASREKMIDEWETIDKNKAQTRPPHWGGFRILPIEIEFWVMGEFRLHDRFRWTRKEVSSTDWKMERLYP